MSAPFQTPRELTLAINDDTRREQKPAMESGSRRLLLLVGARLLLEAGCQQEDHATSKKSTTHTRIKAGTDAIGQVWTSPPLLIMPPLTTGGRVTAPQANLSKENSHQRAGS